MSAQAAAAFAPVEHTSGRQTAAARHAERLAQRERRRAQPIRLVPPREGEAAHDQQDEGEGDGGADAGVAPVEAGVHPVDDGSGRDDLDRDA
jgi:hypothetical protein